ncbi:hypothetical protein WHR41_00987 [Cladosporium halotolerans]|uniref:SAGA-associated factor 11 n=1 Tax=Cladosporium halotolerans TaxID=1052096 RepID=A0AB34L1X7_9PEZI
MTSPDPQPTLAQIAQRLFDDALHNIIHDLVITRHREHKLLLASLDPTDKLPHCDACKLPRLLDPPLAPKVRGAPAEPPSSTQYCERKPWSRRAGHDIYDNPFPRSDVTGRPPTKKEREAAAKTGGGGGKKDDTATPASEDANGGTAPPSPGANDDTTSNRPLEKGEKKASKIDEKLKKGEYVPWHTCPSCKRSLLITRFAKHLEQCMGLSGRAASRNALARMNGSTPGGSRGGTPNPSQEREEDDEDDAASVKESGGVRKKLLKKGLDKKIKKMGEKGGAVNGKLPKVGGGNKKTPGGGGSRASPAPSGGGDGKRDREDLDEDEDEVHVKKRQKLTRVGSTASMASSNALGHELERTESQDGSFVDDASVADD